MLHLVVEIVGVRSPGFLRACIEADHAANDSTLGKGAVSTRLRDITGVLLRGQLLHLLLITIITN